VYALDAVAPNSERDKKNSRRVEVFRKTFAPIFRAAQVGARCARQGEGDLFAA
jgi:hypothetical protein